MCAGTVRLILVPSPNAPERLLPQHHNSPPARMPQVCTFPALTLVQSVAVPMRTGAVRGVVDPSPSCPSPFVPQHHSSPLWIAQVCATPALTDVHPKVTPTRITGDGVAAVGAPSWPDVLSP